MFEERVLMRNMLIDFIVDDINNVCYFDKISFLEKHKIKNEVRLRYGLFRKGNSDFKKSVTDMLYLKSSNERDYIYYIIEAYLTLNMHDFNYKAYEYCEKRIVKRNTEQWFMFHCFKRMMEKENKLSTDALCSVIRSLLLVQYPIHTEIDLERMFSYIEKARQECLHFFDYPNSVHEVCDLYITELNNLWSNLIKEG